MQVGSGHHRRAQEYFQTTHEINQHCSALMKSPTPKASEIR